MTGEGSENVTFADYLEAHPELWHGWPTLTLSEDDEDHHRLDRLLAGVSDAARIDWFGAATKDPVALFTEVSLEIAEVRLRHRRGYVKRVAGTPGVAQRQRMFIPAEEIVDAEEMVDD